MAPNKTILASAVAAAVAFILTVGLLYLIPFFPAPIILILGGAVAAVSFRLPRIGLLTALGVSAVATLYQSPYYVPFFAAAILLVLAGSENWKIMAGLVSGLLLALTQFPYLAPAPIMAVAATTKPGRGFFLGLVSSIAVFVILWLRGVKDASFIFAPNALQGGFAKPVPEPWNPNHLTVGIQSASMDSMNQYLTTFSASMADLSFYVQLAGWMAAGGLAAYAYSRFRNRVSPLLGSILAFVPLAGVAAFGAFRSGTDLTTIIPAIAVSIVGGAMLSAFKPHLVKTAPQQVAPSPVVASPPPELHLHIEKPVQVVLEPTDTSKARTESWFRPETEGQARPQISELDQLVEGGLPQKYNLVLTSPVCDERELLIKKFLLKNQAAEKAILVVSQETPMVEDLAKNFSNLQVLVCTNVKELVLKGLTNISKANSVDDLTDLNLSLSMFLRTHVQGQTSRLCLGLLSDILLRQGAAVTNRWLSELLPRLKNMGLTTLAILNPLMHSFADTQSAIEMFDGWLDIREREDQDGKLARFLTVKRMAGAKYDEREHHLEKRVLEA